MSKVDLIKAIRNRTNLSYKDITKAIDTLQTEDEGKIIDYLREQGVLKAQAREGRETNYGSIFSYVHDGRIGVLLEIKCETDFVALSDDFKQLGQDICLHIVAFAPKFVDEASAPEEFVAKEIEIAAQQLENEGKTGDMVSKILEGKKAKIIKENALLSQAFIKDQDITVNQAVINVGQETGEKITVTRFSLFALNG